MTGRIPLAISLLLLMAPPACTRRTVDLISERGSDSATSGDSGSEIPRSTDNDTDTGPAVCADGPLHLSVTEVDVGREIQANEQEVDLAPVVLSPISTGGARLAFMGTDGNAHVVTLDPADNLVGAPFSIPAHDLQDLYAEEDGGVLLVTRDALGGGTLNCGDEANLCTAPETPIPCHDMVLVRFTDSGERWATRLTASSATLPPYSTGPTGPGVTMIWWYTHHGRIASNGNGWAAYFGSAISITNGTCINVHQGDRMQMVQPDGALVDGGFGWGCSPSGYEQIVWNQIAHAYVAVCKSETDDGNGGSNGVIAFAPDKSLIRQVDPWYANLGELVVADDGGYWIGVSDRQEGQPERAEGAALIRLLHTTSDGVDVEETIGQSDGLNLRAPHLANLGNGTLLLAWESSTTPGNLTDGGDRTLHLQLRSGQDGTPIGDPVIVPGAQGHRYHALRVAADGTAAIPLGDTTGSTVRILRVTSCTP